jgi:hypothetical protein
MPPFDSGLSGGIGGRTAFAYSDLPVSTRKSFCTGS